MLNQNQKIVTSLFQFLNLLADTTSNVWKRVIIKFFTKVWIFSNLFRKINRYNTFSGSYPANTDETNNAGCIQILCKQNLSNFDPSPESPPPCHHMPSSWFIHWPTLKNAYELKISKFYFNLEQLYEFTSIICNATNADNDWKISILQMMTVDGIDMFTII